MMPGLRVMARRAAADMRPQFTANVIAINPTFAALRPLCAAVRGNNGTATSIAARTAMIATTTVALVRNSRELTGGYFTESI